jgi:predicted molibdopterin-dependent oxidoreductase YjgC
MFSRLPDATRRKIAFTFDGMAASGCDGDSVAAALLASGVRSFRRSPADGSERGPFCLIGACFECLVTIDGAGNRQACLTPLREGMTVTTQDGARRLGA